MPQLVKVKELQKARELEAKLKDLRKQLGTKAGPGDLLGNQVVEKLDGKVEEMGGRVKALEECAAAQTVVEKLLEVYSGLRLDGFAGGESMGAEPIGSTFVKIKVAKYDEEREAEALEAEGEGEDATRALWEERRN
jgi:hypothetical protein